jgi:UrcA family protein
MAWGVAIDETLVGDRRVGVHSTQPALVDIVSPPPPAIREVPKRPVAGIAGPNHHSPLSQGVHVMKSITRLIAALIVSGSILSVAEATPPSDVPTAVVKFGDLDATRPAGKEELYRRLTHAARSVCHSLDPSESGAKLQLTPLYKACIDQAVSGAVAQINRPEFTDYVASRMPKPDHAGIQLAAR